MYSSSPESGHHPLRAFIVDDEARCREALKHLLSKYCPDVSVDTECESVRAALEVLRESTPDILFLDVVLQDGTGFDVLQRADCENISIIFTTAHDEHALKAIKFSALDYLMKPVDADELVAAVGKARHAGATREVRTKQLNLLRQNLGEGPEAERIALPTLDGFTFVELASIVFCEAQSNYTRFKFRDGESVIVCRTLKDYENLLEEHGFFRIHRSHMINLRHLERYVRGKGGYVVMSSGAELEVSPRCKEALLEKVKL